MVLKYIFDRLVSLIGMICLCWLYLLVAILIKVKMPGPVLFVQQRVGRNGKIFRCHKFRSMSVSKTSATASKNSTQSSIASEEQNRITPLGEKLRRYKIDELPELWDVFIGKMSFVGPRPDVPGYADQLTGTDRDVLQLRPGITGPASLKYRNEEELLANIAERLKQEEVLCINGIEIRSVQEYNDRIIYPDKVRLNYYYFHHYSFIQDIRMIIATIFGKQIEYAGEKI